MTVKTKAVAALTDTTSIHVVVVSSAEVDGYMMGFATEDEAKEWRLDMAGKGYPHSMGTSLASVRSVPSKDDTDYVMFRVSKAMDKLIDMSRQLVKDRQTDRVNKIEALLIEVLIASIPICAVAAVALLYGKLF
jgi:hypothetical protein